MSDIIGGQNFGPLFAKLPPVARTVDPHTSHAGQAHIRPHRRTQAQRLLDVYRTHPEGLTDEEAADLAGIKNGGWKRCSDLRAVGLIVADGTTRASSSGVESRVCAIPRNPCDTLSAPPTTRP